MYISASDLHKFYNSDIGLVVQSLLSQHIRGFWPDVHGLRIMGCGYAAPYLAMFGQDSERVVAMTSQGQGQCHWLNHETNSAFLADENRMPVETCSVDRLLLVHYLECCDNLQGSLQEAWRVLKSNGRLLVIVPNRTGVWARADWSPFGHGRPFTSSQLALHLRHSQFVQESSRGALFVPPIPNSPIVMKSANLIEKMGSTVLPFVAGVHMVECSKKIYATIDRMGTGSTVLSKTKEILGGKSAPVPQRSLTYSKQVSD